MQRSYRVISALLGVLMPLSMNAAEEAAATDLASALTAGKATIAGRYRFEHVDQDNALKKANASTLRLRLNYRTGKWNGWSGFAEFDHVFHVLVDDFDSGAGTSPNRSEYSVVADPEGSDLNQLYLEHNGEDDWKFRLGRQRILLDNQRFVGGVGWRQNEQTYDALTLNAETIANTALTYSYVNRVRRIFGQTVDAGSDRIDGHLFNARVRLNENWSVTPYFYYLDYAFGNLDVPDPDPNDSRRAASSTATAGARVAGSVVAGSGKVQLLAEFATQSDAADAPVNYDANYLHVNAAWALQNGLSIGLGFESLGGSSQPGKAFRTPLATLHAFNGWADQFLTTPAGGIDDSYITLKYPVGGWDLTGVYHDFAAATGAIDYGAELDLSAGRKVGERYGVLLKAALFAADSDSSLVDANKFWVMLTASY